MTSPGSSVSIFVVVSMPLVLFSGYLEWQIKYVSNLTSLFIVKIACAETFEKCQFFLEFKEGDNFNRPSTICRTYPG